MNKTDLDVIRDVIRADIAELSTRVSIIFDTQCEFSRKVGDAAHLFKAKFEEALRRDADGVPSDDRRILKSFTALSPETLVRIIGAINDGAEEERDAFAPILEFVVESLDEPARVRLFDLLQKQTVG